MAVILVGAMLVSGIQTVWSTEETYTKTIKKTLYDGSMTLERGAELGYFKMGSTVIVLFAKECVEWSHVLQPASLVKMGQLVGTRCT
jgi:phosphatidylserine decarboxylase